MFMRQNVLFYNANDENRYGRSKLPFYEQFLKGVIQTYLDKPVSFVIELGCGKGALQHCHSRYVGIDLSHFALKKYLLGKHCIQADAEEIPLKNNSVTLVFEIATLEHIPRPERCLAEIDRILQPGGIAVFAPTWFCRPWIARGLHLKRFKELSWKDKFTILTLPVRTCLLFRAAFVLPQRLIRELFYYFRKPSPLPFRYRKLKPNLKEYLCPDSDAFSSMDPHMAILYYLSRGYEIIGEKGLWSRIFMRPCPVIVRKSKTAPH